MAAEDNVRQASAQFYAALNQMLDKGNASALSDVWAHSPDVTTMHPIGGREVGWDQVRSSFEQVAQLCSGGQVLLQNPLLQILGDVACESGTESGQATMAGQSLTFSHRVTNIYRLEGGQWKLVHHHTDVTPAMVDVMSRLQG
ncbi:MAG TPA: nuclear transport factor 2 family protein [Ktedonobacterales bacterium]